MRKRKSRLSSPEFRRCQDRSGFVLLASVDDSFASKVRRRRRQTEVAFAWFSDNLSWEKVPTARSRASPRVRRCPQTQRGRTRFVRLRLRCTRGQSHLRARGVAWQPAHTASLAPHGPAASFARLVALFPPEADRRASSLAPAVLL